MSRHGHHANQFLARLPEPDQKAVFTCLKTVDLPRSMALHETGEPFRAAYFPHSGIISLVVDLATGDIVEAGTVGRDGVVGGAAAMLGAVPLNRAVVQIAGTASVIAANDLRRLIGQRPAARDRLFLHQQFLLAQAQQCAACNAVHPIEKRLARWLLRCRDLVGSDEFALTQEFLAEMLAVRRTSVSLIANALQRAGLIAYGRGRIRLLDVEGLRAATCECYDAINDSSERLLGYGLRSIA